MGILNKFRENPFLSDWAFLAGGNLMGGQGHGESFSSAFQIAQRRDESRKQDAQEKKRIEARKKEVKAAADRQARIDKEQAVNRKSVRDNATRTAERLEKENQRKAKASESRIKSAMSRAESVAKMKGADRGHVDRVYAAARIGDIDEVNKVADNIRALGKPSELDIHAGKRRFDIAHPLPTRELTAAPFVSNIDYRPEFKVKKAFNDLVMKNLEGDKPYGNYKPEDYAKAEAKAKEQIGEGYGDVPKFIQKPTTQAADPNIKAEVAKALGDYDGPTKTGISMIEQALAKQGKDPESSLRQLVEMAEKFNSLGVPDPAGEAMKAFLKELGL